MLEISVNRRGIWAVSSFAQYTIQKLLIRPYKHTSLFRCKEYQKIIYIRPYFYKIISSRIIIVLKNREREGLVIQQFLKRGKRMLYKCVVCINYNGNKNNIINNYSK